MAPNLDENQFRDGYGNIHFSNENPPKQKHIKIRKSNESFADFQPLIIHGH